MKKNNIFFTFLLFNFLLNTANAQKRTILFQNDTITFIHDSYIDVPNHNSFIYGVLYAIEKNSKPDTIGTPNAYPRGKSYFDGTYFTTNYQYLTRFSEVDYSIMKKINGKWRLLTYYGGSLDQPHHAIYTLDQTDIFTLKELLTKDGSEDLVSELKVEIGRASCRERV